ncbi:MAG: SGNH/GDSL hydrolase family protein [Dehalococcoidia bacterium]
MTTLLVGVGVALLVGVVVLEIALRLYAGSNPAFLARLRSQDILAVKVEPMGDFGFRQKPNTFLRYENGTIANANSLGYRGPEVSCEKPKGTTRIVLVGGSSTYGWGVEDDQTLDEYMRQELSTRYPGRRFEVVNLAFDGYDSFQDYERIRIEGLGYQPDVIVVNNGINDVRNARYPDLQDPDPRTLLWRDLVGALRAQAARGGPDFKSRLKHGFYSLQFVASVRGDWEGQKLLTARGLPEQPEPNPEAFDYFERNIRRIATLANEAGVALLLSTSPSSIRTKYPPDARSPRDYWIGDAAATQKLREEIDRRMRRVAADLQATQPVRYVDHTVPASMFLDDAHLTPEGNQALARAFCDGMGSWIDATIAASAPQT